MNNNESVTKQCHCYSRFLELKANYFQTSEETLEDTLSNSILKRFRNVSSTDLVIKWCETLKLVSKDLFEARGVKPDISEFLFHLKQLAISNSVHHKSKYSVRENIFNNFSEGFLYLFNHIEPVTYTKDVFLARSGINLRASNQIFENFEPFSFIYIREFFKNMNFKLLSTKMNGVQDKNENELEQNEDNIVINSVESGYEMPRTENNMLVKEPDFKVERKRRKVCVYDKTSKDSKEPFDRNEKVYDLSEEVLPNSKRKKIGKTRNLKRKIIKSPEKRREGLRSMHKNASRENLPKVELAILNGSSNNNPDPSGSPLKIRNNKKNESKNLEESSLFYGFEDSSDEDVIDEKILEVYHQNLSNLKRKKGKYSKKPKIPMPNNSNRKLNNISEKKVSVDSFSYSKSNQSLKSILTGEHQNKVTPDIKTPIVLVRPLSPTTLLKFKGPSGPSQEGSSTNSSSSLEGNKYMDFGRIVTGKMLVTDNAHMVERNQGSSSSLHKNPHIDTNMRDRYHQTSSFFMRNLIDDKHSIVKHLGSMEKSTNDINDVAQKNPKSESSTAKGDGHSGMVKLKRGRPRKGDGHSGMPKKRGRPRKVPKVNELESNKAHHSLETSNLSSAESALDSIGDSNNPPRDPFRIMPDSVRPASNHLRGPSKLSEEVEAERYSSMSNMNSNNASARPVARIETHQNRMSDTFLKKGKLQSLSSSTRGNSRRGTSNNRVPSRTAFHVIRTVSPDRSPSESAINFLRDPHIFTAGPSNANNNVCQNDSFNHPQPCSSRFEDIARQEATVRAVPPKDPFSSLFQQCVSSDEDGERGQAYNSEGEDSNNSEVEHCDISEGDNSDNNEEQADDNHVEPVDYGSDEEEDIEPGVRRNRIINQQEEIIDLGASRPNFDQRNLNVTRPNMQDLAMRGQPVQYSCITANEMIQIRNHQPPWYNGFMRSYHNICSYKINELRKMANDIMAIENRRLQLVDRINAALYNQPE